MKHTISVLVENHVGVLAHVSGLFSSRGFNITSLAVGETEDPSISRMTIVAGGDEKVLEQIMKQLNKLVDVIKVIDMNRQESIERELVLVKVSITSSSRMEVMQIVNTFRAKIVDVDTHALTVEVTGTESKVDAMLELLRPYGIKEVARTGIISMARKNELSAKASAKKQINEKALPKPKKKSKSKKKR